MVTLGTLSVVALAAGLPDPRLPRRPGRHRGLPRRPPGRRRHHRAGPAGVAQRVARSSPPSAWRCCSSAWSSTAGTRSSAARAAGRRHHRVAGAGVVRPGLRRREYNRGLRSRLHAPDRVPDPRRLAVGLVIFGFSRVMLTVDKNAAVGRSSSCVGGLVLVVAVALRRPAGAIGGDVLVGTLMVGGIIVLTAGVISVVQGERGVPRATRSEGAEHRDGGRRRQRGRPVRRSRNGRLSPDRAHPAPGRAVSITFNNSVSGPRRLVVEEAEGLECAGQSLGGARSRASPALRRGRPDRRS